MASQRSAASPFESEYATPGTWISGSQWVAEKMCERLARSQREKLPPHFWRLPKWAKVFRRQVALAAEFLREHDVAAVAVVLRDREMEWCHSLANADLIKAVRAAQRRLDAEAAAPRVEVPLPPAPSPQATPWSPTPTVSAGPASALSQLMGL